MNDSLNIKSTNPNKDSENQSGIDESENKYYSHPEKEPHQDKLITTDEQDISSNKNEYEGSDDDDLNENKVAENKEDSDNFDKNKLDENGFPKYKDSSFPSNI